MPSPSQKRTINGNTWEAYPWQALHGLKMQARIGKIIGPALSKMGGDLDTSIPAAVGMLFERIDENELPKLVKDLLFGTTINNKDTQSDLVFNDHFSGNYGELYEGLAFILEVNFGSLFQMAGRFGFQTDPAKQGKDYREG